MQLTDNEPACAEIKLTFSPFFLRFKGSCRYQYFMRYSYVQQRHIRQLLPSSAWDHVFYVFVHKYVV
jgi:hypothetical protein